MAEIKKKDALARHGNDSLKAALLELVEAGCVTSDNKGRWLKPEWEQNIAAPRFAEEMQDER